MILNFLKAMWTWARGGFELLPQFMINMRHMTCRDCDEFRKGWIRTYCNQCKCTTTQGHHPFNKLAHPCQECPLGKWSKVSGYNCEDENENST